LTCQETVLGALLYGGGIQSYANGAIAYPAMWSAYALTQTDVNTLYNSGSGSDPGNVQSVKQSSLLYMQSSAPYFDTVHNANWTVFGTPTVVSDPFSVTITTLVPDLRFGFATHFDQGWSVSLMPAIAGTGVGWIRDDFNWSFVEQTKGVYQVGNIKPFWATAHANGLKCVGIIGSNSIYTNPYDPTGMSNFCAWLAVQGNVAPDVFEIVNEPNNIAQFAGANSGGNTSNLNTLVTLTNAVRASVHAVNPNIAVIGLGEQGSDILYMLSNGAVVDGVVYHPYDTGDAQPATDIPDTAYEPPYTQYYNWIIAIQAATTLPLWETEWGVGTINGFTQDNQADYLVRRLLVAALLGVEHTFIYEFRDNSASDLFGVYDINSVPKTSYSAVTNTLATLNGVIGDTVNPGTLNSVANGNTGDVDLGIYRGTNKTVVASWFHQSSPSAPPASSTASITFTVSSPYTVGASTVYDPIAGTRIPLSTYNTTVNGNAVTVTGLPISDHPLLIVLQGQPAGGGSGLTASSDLTLARKIIGVTTGAYVIPANNYWALYTTQFTAAAKAGATEWLAASDTAYVRQAMGTAGIGWTIAAYASGTGVVWSNTNTLTQPAVAGTAQTLFACGWCDALVAGNIDFFIDLATSVSVGIGTQVVLTASTGAIFTLY
jgi:hypothetical protein